ncbi:TPA: pseudaminic acid synthase [Candidatus Berkelbacteria bacterium]|uniref:Pseudaminic acid synthase n=1 Tax=Berkelbacteria bacterium GW2011_GWE1_39_12 TaxID=1618337 RepID=A0A0G4B3R0_9BACT|nr:MAG: pseudaminic acid synthase [Berkelbacteria bacterium GW2011_GWE1_39_12]HBO60783.1 pseudaminic acid synthase [Candidatus Berkelbacteria bacterium]
MSSKEIKFKIGKHNIGKNEPVFVIAELSANHGHKFSIAAKTIKAMKKAGADAVKLQTYTPDTITIDSDNACFKIKQGTIWDGKNLHKLYQEAYMPWDWQPKLKKIAEDLGMICFSSPFDNTAVNFLEKMKVPAYKIASFEITDIPLIEYVAKKNKPIIISTGVAELADIKEAVAACKRMGNHKIALLKCTSSYPASYEEMNLNTIPDMQKKFKTIAGLSDHSLNIEIPVAAVACGAKIIEKHFILDKKIGGPDVAFSLEPNEFKAMVQNIRNTEKALGQPTYVLSGASKKNREFSRSLFAVEDIGKNEKFTEKNIRSIRPGFGLPPKYLKVILNKLAKKNIKRGTPLDKEMF